jgi:hypothetical protein
MEKQTNKNPPAFLEDGNSCKKSYSAFRSLSPGGDKRNQGKMTIYACQFSFKA